MSSFVKMLYICAFMISFHYLSYMKLTLSMLLQCGVCARALGDMLTPMFLKDQVIQCGVCFSEAVKKWCLFGTNMFPENSPSIPWWMCCPLFPITSLSTSSFFLFLSQLYPVKGQYIVMINDSAMKRIN